VSGHRLGADLRDAAESFDKMVDRHEMTVLLDQDGYRHLQFRHRREDGSLTSMYGFEIITWPWHLTITGDLGHFTFSREQDMVGFFGADRYDGYSINPGYWVEKLKGAEDVERFSYDLFEQTVNELVNDWLEDRDLPEDAAAELRSAIEDEVFGEVYETGPVGVAYDRLYNFTWQWNDPQSGQRHEFQFYDPSDLTFTDWTRQYLWCCYAIVWGLLRYQQVPAFPKAAVPPTWAPKPKPKDETTPATAPTRPPTREADGSLVRTETVKTTGGVL
jgi:hypothetical protein